MMAVHKGVGHYGAPITLEQAKKVMAAAEAKARQNDWNVVISIVDTETALRDVEAAARTIGLQLQVLKAKTAREIEEGFAWSERPDALFVAATAFLNIRRVQLVQLAAFHRIPATYGQREAAEAGGLMSYGPSILEGYRQWVSMLAVYSRGRNPETCRWRSRPSSSSSSTTQPCACLA
jgi:ABC-type uncharacterized transport system substrate-binding protein